MDEVIDRARRGEASAEELASLEAWRRESSANERAYRNTVRLLEAGRALGDVSSTISPPTAAAVIARVGARRRFASRHTAARWAPWAIASAAAVVAAIDRKSVV